MRPLRRKGDENWPHGLRDAGARGGVPELHRVAQVLRTPRGVARRRGLRCDRAASVGAAIAELQ